MKDNRIHFKNELFYRQDLAEKAKQESDNYKKIEDEVCFIHFIYDYIDDTITTESCHVPSTEYA